MPVTFGKGGGVHVGDPNDVHRKLLRAIPKGAVRVEACRRVGWVYLRAGLPVVVEEDGSEALSDSFEAACEREALTILLCERRK